MNQHASSGPPSSDVPELPFAEQARTLVHRARTGTLCTQSQRQGFPFGSISLYGLDGRGLVARRDRGQRRPRWAHVVVADQPQPFELFVRRAGLAPHASQHRQVQLLGFLRQPLVHRTSPQSF